MDCSEANLLGELEGRILKDTLEAGTKVVKAIPWVSANYGLDPRGEVTAEFFQKRADEWAKKRLFVLCDGTWKNAAGTSEPLTNVARLARAVDRYSRNTDRPEFPIPQISYYSVGVGSESNLPKIPLDSFYSGLTGSGLEQDILRAYCFLCNNFNFRSQKDEIILVGYSRGAFTVRCLADFVSCVGLIRRKNLPFLSILFKRWAEARGDEEKGLLRERIVKLNENDQANQGDNLTQRPRFSYFAKIAVLAEWDPVSSVGFLGWKKFSVVSDTVPDAVQNAIVAIALDERRGSFEPMPWRYKKDYQSVSQFAFRGCHEDIGGGSVNAALSTISLLWVVSRITSVCDARFDTETLLQMIHPPQPYAGLVSSTETESKNSLWSKDKINESFTFWWKLGYGLSCGWHQALRWTTLNPLFLQATDVGGEGSSQTGPLVPPAPQHDTHGYPSKVVVGSYNCKPEPNPNASDSRSRNILEVQLDTHMDELKKSVQEMFVSHCREATTAYIMVPKYDNANQLEDVTFMATLNWVFSLEALCGVVKDEDEDENGNKNRNEDEDGNENRDGDGDWNGNEDEDRDENEDGNKDKNKNKDEDEDGDGDKNEIEDKDKDEDEDKDKDKNRNGDEDGNKDEDENRNGDEDENENENEDGDVDRDEGEDGDGDGETSQTTSHRSHNNPATDAELIISTPPPQTDSDNQNTTQPANEHRGWFLRTVGIVRQLCWRSLRGMASSTERLLGGGFKEIPDRADIQRCGLRLHCTVETTHLEPAMGEGITNWLFRMIRLSDTPNHKAYEKYRVGLTDKEEQLWNGLRELMELWSSAERLMNSKIEAQPNSSERMNSMKTVYEQWEIQVAWRIEMLRFALFNELGDMDKDVFKKKNTQYTKVVCARKVGRVCVDLYCLFDEDSPGPGEGEEQPAGEEGGQPLEGEEEQQLGEEGEQQADGEGGQPPGEEEEQPAGEEGRQLLAKELAKLLTKLKKAGLQDSDELIKKANDVCALLLKADRNRADVALKAKEALYQVFISVRSWGYGPPKSKEGFFDFDPSKYKVSTTTTVPVMVPTPAPTEPNTSE
ncbi:hypothetical protein TWF679_002638 [Orbilia oligospora]|uniref:T6SS Phospholipase effector Tle1-like catalytic domain-containing protein n=1 Tax=Orbilia oligospora TaxID=2813651 RepID=A0A8H8UT04_ORBOL|nr:hypothetical protein TWF679_002638 [Orbilia oligospora]